LRRICFAADLLCGGFIDSGLKHSTRMRFELARMAPFTSPAMNKSPGDLDESTRSQAFSTTIVSPSSSGGGSDYANRIIVVAIALQRTAQEGRNHQE